MQMLPSVGSIYFPSTKTPIKSEKKDSNRSSKHASLSSTPHAPRHRKPVALPKTQGPSTHDLLKQHSYLEQDLLNCASSNGSNHHVPKATPPSVRQAWNEPTSVVQSQLVQPYRRIEGRRAPLGVPLLDLSAMNEPDENMEPVELLLPRLEHPTTTVRDGSLMSWGIRYAIPGSNSTEETPVISEELKVDDVITDKPSSRESSHDEQPVTVVELESTKMDFVEGKLLSHERDKEAVQHSSTQHTRGPEMKPPRTTFGPSTGIPMASLSKRLRFEARVVTQNGRDVHRELCGFYFLVDGSIAIYEYRQFGKKSSALPLIQRGVFSHLTGHKRGEQYDINYIRKGAVLHFRPREHPNLPDSLGSRPLLTIKICQVDERNKRQLLCTGRNPIECRSIEVYLSATPTPSEEKEHRLLKTLQGMVCSRLCGRAPKAVVGLGRSLRGGANNGIVSKLQLEQAMRTFHISLTVEDYSHLWQLYKSNELVIDDGLSVDCCIPALTGGMSEDRMTLVRKVFHKIDASKTGAISVSEMRKFFNASNHPAVMKGQRRAEEVWLEMVECLTENTSSFMYRESRNTDLLVRYADFENYYEGLSIEVPKDIDFINFMRNCWTVS